MFYTKNISEIEKELKTSVEDGLSYNEVENRLAKNGYNQIESQNNRTPLKIFLEQFVSFMIWILIGAAVISGVIGEFVDSIAIMFIVLANAIFGFMQEYQAEKALESLKSMSVSKSKVFRNGELKEIDSKELVAGDIIEFELGDVVPADSRLISTSLNFATIEASLTGESTNSVKNAELVLDEDVSLADRVNMIYKGTSIASGRGKAIVVATGMDTELGKIAGMLDSTIDEKTPLQKELAKFGKNIVYLALFIVFVIFIIGLFQGKELIELLMTSISLAVAAIPEGLPAVVTISLAIGVKRLVKRNALIRKLPAVETLGCSSVICSDKTGTLTKNQMTVQSLFVDNQYYGVSGLGYRPEGSIFRISKDDELNDFLDEGKEFDLNKIDKESNSIVDNLIKISVLCNGATLDKNDYTIIGDPTEGALLTLGEKFGYTKKDLEEKYKLHFEIPFDSKRKLMTMIRKSDDAYQAFIKGAPDELLDKCSKILTSNGVRDITEDDINIVNKINHFYSTKALRVLGYGYKIVEKKEEYLADETESNIVFVGLSAMIDPPREEAKVAIEQCKTAGIRTIMITGDHKDTASAIALKLGFPKTEPLAYSGRELDEMNEREFDNNVKDINIFARVSPEHKLKIVKSLKKQGYVSSMTGDGVNDAPALKEADIGVAMGITGTDVTKGVADMIVTDDNFSSIVSAVEEGRGIFDNIKKFIHYLLSCNAGEIILMFLSSIMALPIPLIPIHILWVNLVTDGFPALALGVEPKEKDIMERKPRDKSESIVNGDEGLRVFLQGFIIGVLTLIGFVFSLKVMNFDVIKSRTIAFFVLATTQLFHALNSKSLDKSLFKVGVFSNIKLIWACVLSLVLEIAILYIPFTQKVFQIVPLSLIELLSLIAYSSVILWILEIVKFYNKCKDKYFD